MVRDRAATAEEGSLEEAWNGELQCTGTVVRLEGGWLSLPFRRKTWSRKDERDVRRRRTSACEDNPCMMGNSRHRVFVNAFARTVARKRLCARSVRLRHPVPRSRMPGKSMSSAAREDGRPAW